MANLRGQRQAGSPGPQASRPVSKFSPDGQSLLLGGADGVTRLFRLDATNPQEWTPDRVIPRAFPWLPSEEIKAAAFHPDGRRFLIARSTPLSGVAELWSIQEQKQPLATFAH